MQKKDKNNEKEAANTKSDFHIEIDKVRGRVSVSVSGVASIVDFSEENVTLKLKKGKIKIGGRTLSITVYEDRIVEIVGVIGAFEFL